MCMQKGELLRIGTIFLGLLFVVLRITNTKAYEQIDFSLDYQLRIDCLQ